ncbi:MAG: ATP-dependent metallopeptidase FtsH/Yme1/Tma family protein [Rhodospirillales bacterium]|nr:MAG: ATP-dependent metallopeptidase FtsH/Yme1/Tma family protein [Rhodospirillales bacterium]
MKGNRRLGLWLLAGLVLFLLFSAVQGPSPGAQGQELSYSEFVANVEAGGVSDVSIRGQEATGTLRDGQTFTTVIPEGADVVPTLVERGVRVSASPPPQPSLLSSLFISAFPVLLLIAVWIYFMRRMQGGGPGGGIMGFGKSRARMLAQDHRRVTFDEVAGIDEAKQELEEIVDFLKDPQRFQRLGGQIPKGCLLVGPPGTGKTLLARAIAGEANVPFFTISGSDFVEMFVGVGASRVRDMFEQAKKNSPCIVFIDEIDAVGRHRGTGLGGGHDEREQTLNQLLVEMDGFEANEGVILIAATNRPDVLDPALLRPGRFDRQVVVPNPDVLGREQILKVHMKKVPLAPDVKPRVIARGTPGFSGADLANLVNEAALLAARAARRKVTMADFEAAKDKIMMGSERRSMVMTEDEKRLTAFHEAGHALVGLFVPGNDPLHKVTIIPRGRALGVTMNLPERDRYSMKKSEIEARLAMMFGGRVAETLVFGTENVTTGASNDIMQATNFARRMVTEWGMSDRLGRLRYSDNEEEIFLGRSITRTQNVAEETAQIIDEELRRIIESAERTAVSVLTEHLDDLHQLAQALLEYESLSGDEVRIILDGGSIDRPDEESAAPKTRPGRRSVPQASAGKGRPDDGGPIEPAPGLQPQG